MYLRSVFILLFACTTLNAASLRVLLVGDTNDRSIGKSVVIDLTHMEEFVREVATATGLKLDLKILKAAQIKSQLVKNAVNAIKPDKDDTVIFYYSGHGFRTKAVKTKWPLLYIPDAGDKGVDFQWIIDTLNKKNPRMLVALTDSCNSFIDDPPLKMNSRAMQQDKNALWKKLFVEFSGRIYASGSSVGQFSFGQDVAGGLFTNQFLAAVRSQVKKSDTNWDVVMPLATRKISVNNAQQPSQDPQYELLKGASQSAVAQTEQAPIQAQEATSAERSEDCKNVTEFQEALSTITQEMPEKLNFRQKKDVAYYNDLVRTLRSAGGDKEMQTQVRAMNDNMRRKNWKNFRLAYAKYENHIESVRVGVCRAK